MHVNSTLHDNIQHLTNIDKEQSMFSNFRPHGVTYKYLKCISAILNFASENSCCMGKGDSRHHCQYKLYNV